MIGIVCAYFFGLILVKKHNLNSDDYLVVCAYLIAFGFVGAKVLYILVSIKEIDFSLVFSSLQNFNAFVSSGFVFYGGFIGGFFAFWFMKKVHKIDSNQYLKIIVPALGIAHCFGRIGCSFAGCCHGVETTSSFAFIYKKSLAAPNNVPLFPVQGLEAFFILILSVVCFIIIYKNKNVRIYYLYIVCYSILRFILEFYRGDSVRGLFGGISTSQIISIIIFVLAITTYFIKKVKVSSYYTKQEK